MINPAAYTIPRLPFGTRFWRPGCLWWRCICPIFINVKSSAITPTRLPWRSDKFLVLHAELSFGAQGNMQPLIKYPIHHSTISVCGGGSIFAPVALISCAASGINLVEEIGRRKHCDVPSRFFSASAYFDPCRCSRSDNHERPVLPFRLAQSALRSVAYDQPQRQPVGCCGDSVSPA